MSAYNPTLSYQPGLSHWLNVCFSKVCWRVLTLTYIVVRHLSSYQTCGTVSCKNFLYWVINPRPTGVFL